MADTQKPKCRDIERRMQVVRVFNLVFAIGTAFAVFMMGSQMSALSTTVFATITFLNMLGVVYATVGDCERESGTEDGDAFNSGFAAALVFFADVAIMTTIAMWLSSAILFLIGSGLLFSVTRAAAFASAIANAAYNIAYMIEYFARFGNGGAREDGSAEA